MAASDPDPQQESQQDETRRKFREALERKQDKAAGAAARAEAAGKQSKAHGPVGGRRTFRRKSGG